MSGIIGILVIAGFFLYSYIKHRQSRYEGGLRQQEKEIVELKRQRMHQIYDDIYHLKQTNHPLKDERISNLQYELDEIKKHVNEYDMVKNAIQAKADEIMRKRGGYYADPSHERYRDPQDDDI